MKIQTQLTLSGEEAAEYMEYRTELARLGFTSFDSLKKEQKRLEKLHKEVQFLQNIRKAILARIKHDGVCIVGGGQCNSIEDMLKLFERIVYDSLNEYARGKSIITTFESEVLKALMSSTKLQELIKDKS